MTVSIGKYLFSERYVINPVIILLLLWNCSLAQENGKLVKIVMLFRHGMRAPAMPLYLDESLEESNEHWPDGYGSLVKHGKWQMFNLGQRLHERYKDFLTPYSKTISDDIKVVTTRVHRCYLSAGYLLTGLYPLSSNQTWSEEITWPPILILPESPDQSHIIAMKEACPSYHSHLGRSFPSTDRSDIRHLIKYISKRASHLNITTINDLFMFSDYLTAKLAMNLTIPNWVSVKYYTKLRKFLEDSFHYLSETVQMCRLISGPLIKAIMQSFKEVIYRQSANSKMFLFSGHDASLHTIAKILGFHLKFAPNYAASMIFEVYRFAPTDYKIRVLYGKDHTFNDVENWTLPECGEEFCPVGKFNQIVEKFFVDDWEKECNI